MIQRHQRAGALLPLFPARERRPLIRVVLHADDLLQSSSVVETVIDALYDRMPRANVVVCVRRAWSEQIHE